MSDGSKSDQGNAGILAASLITVMTLVPALATAGMPGGSGVTVSPCESVAEASLSDPCFLDGEIAAFAEMAVSASLGSTGRDGEEAADLKRYFTHPVGWDSYIQAISLQDGIDGWDRSRDAHANAARQSWSGTEDGIFTWQVTVPVEVKLTSSEGVKTEKLQAYLSIVRSHDPLSDRGIGIADYVLIR